MANFFSATKKVNPRGSIDDVLEIHVDTYDIYRLNNLVAELGTYTFVVWYCSAADCNIKFNVLGTEETVASTTTWNKYVKTVEYDGTNRHIDITQDLDSTIYLYEGYITKGSQDKSWSLAPEDWEDGREERDDLINETMTYAQQTADMFKWVVKSGTNETDFTLTDRTATLISEQINLKGLVTFSGLNSEVPNEILGVLGNEPTEGSTVIHGGHLINNTITTEKVDTGEMYSNSAFIGAVQTTELNANMITAGNINANLLNLYGLKVYQQDTDIETLSVENTGDVTLRGSVESYNYVSGKNGWSIKSNGNAEFNDVDVRGSVIGNYGGIASCGGSGENLQRNTSFADGTIGSYWQNSTGLYTVDTGVLCNGVNSIKYSRSGATENSTAQFYTHIRNNRIIPVAGKYYTASAKFYTKNYSVMDGTKPVLGIWFYSQNEDGTYNKVDAKSVTIPFVDNEWVDASVTLECPEGAEYMSIVVGAYRNGEFWMAQPKLEEGDVATAWSLSPLDGIKQVIHWAGSSYEERESAPWIVYSDGSMVSTKGTFSGVFTGEIEIGNISIIDPSKYSGNDAILTIQHGGNGIKRIQLKDTESSDFAQAIKVTDDFYNEVITLRQDGYGLFSDGIIIGEQGKGATTIKNNSIVLDNSSMISADASHITVISTQFDIGSTSFNNNLTVYGSSTFKESATFQGDIMIGTRLKITSKSNGVDIDFIE